MTPVAGISSPVGSIKPASVGWTWSTDSCVRTSFCFSAIAPSLDLPKQKRGGLLAAPDQLVSHVAPGVLPVAGDLFDRVIDFVFDVGDTLLDFAFGLVGLPF